MFLEFQSIPYTSKIWLGQVFVPALFILHNMTLSSVLSSFCFILRICRRTISEHLQIYTSITKLVKFYHCLTFSPVLINNCALNEAPYLECLLAFKLTPDLKYNSYIQSVTSYTRVRLENNMNHCHYIWAGAVQFSLSRSSKAFSLVSDELFSTLQPITYRWNVASLSLFYGK